MRMASETKLKGPKSLSKPLKVVPGKMLALSSLLLYRYQHDHYTANGLERGQLGSQMAKIDEDKYIA